MYIYMYIHIHMIHAKVICGFVKWRYLNHLKLDHSSTKIHGERDLPIIEADPSYLSIYLSI